MTDEEEMVVLVNERDHEIGQTGKLHAHRSGALHRAVSVFIFDRAGRVLLQRRASGKYHSAGRWANACCTHPRPGESAASAAQRRLREEMGVACALTPRGVFTYRSEVGDGLIEHEIDHLFVGHLDSEPLPNVAEVQETRWANPDDLARAVREQPDQYAVWLAPALAALNRPI